MPGVAIVLDGNQRSALAATRSLGKRDITVYVADARRGSLAASSRYCRSSLVYPDPAAHPDQFSNWLKRLDEVLPSAVLLPMTDTTVPLVLDAAKRFKHLRMALPSAEAYAAASDKFQLFGLARSVGVMSPATAVVSRATTAILDETPWGYPLVVKPRHSTTRTAGRTIKRGVRYAYNRAELIQSVQTMLQDPHDEVLVQEYVAGQGAGVFAFYQSGEPRLFFAHRRIREKPPSGGVSVLSESVALPEAATAAARTLLDALHWNGVAMVEFKIDAQDRPWLVEINARFWGSLQLAVDCGADFPWLVYQAAQGENPHVSQTYAVGNRLRWWLGDLDNLYAQVRDPRLTPTFASKARALGTFLTPWQPRTRDELLRWDDPAPAFAALLHYLGALRGPQS